MGRCTTLRPERLKGLKIAQETYQRGNREWKKRRAPGVHVTGSKKFVKCVQVIQSGFSVRRAAVQQYTSPKRPFKKWTESHIVSRARKTNVTFRPLVLPSFACNAVADEIGKKKKKKGKKKYRWEKLEWVGGFGAGAIDPSGESCKASLHVKKKRRHTISKQGHVVRCEIGSIAKKKSGGS